MESNSNPQGSRGRPFPPYVYYAQPDVGPRGFRNPGDMQGQPNFRGNPYVPYDMQGPRNPTMNNIGFSGVQQAGAYHFAPNYFPGALPPVPQTNEHIVGNQGYPGIPPYSATIGNWANVPGMGVDPVLRHSAPQVPTSVGSVAGGENFYVHYDMQGPRNPTMNNIAFSGVPQAGAYHFAPNYFPGALPLVPQTNAHIVGNQGYPEFQQGNLPYNVPGMGVDPVFRHSAPHIGLNTSPGGLSVRVQNRMRGGTGVFQRQRGSWHKPGVGLSVQQNQGSLQEQGVGPSVQQNQGSLQKQGVVSSVEQNPSVQQSQGSLQKQVVIPSLQQNQGTTTSPRPQQQQQHTPPSASGSVGGPVSNESQPHQNQMSGVGQSSQGDDFGLRGLLNVIKSNDLALGLDLTKLGLDVNPSVKLHETFGSPWLDEPVPKQEYTTPPCYNASERPIGLDGILAILSEEIISKFSENNLFYIFYSMPRDEAQLYAAVELYNRGWIYLKKQQLWVKNVEDTQPVEKTSEYERGSFYCLDHEKLEKIREDNFVLYYNEIEVRPALPQRH